MTTSEPTPLLAVSQLNAAYEGSQILRDVNMTLPEHQLVALMGRNQPLGILAASLLFGALYQGGSELSFDMPHVNRDMVVLIQGLVILFCGALENVFRAPLAALLGSAKPASPS